jgi:putative PEP-CTERM system histidine kinase
LAHPSQEDVLKMPANIGLYSYSTALLAYALLSLAVFVNPAKHRLRSQVLAASTLTTLWAGTIVVSSLLTYPQVKLMQLAEVARNAAWCFLLLQLLAQRLQGSDHILATSRWMLWFVGAFTLVLAALFTTPALSRAFSLGEDLYSDVAFAAWLSMAILGLLLLEQIYRNSSEAERWAVKYLCLGLGFVFAYDFFMYAQALLFRELDPALWQARGVVIALAAIFLAVGFGRIDRTTDSRNLHLSRHVVFHSVTLLAAGIYLIIMALAGYFIRYLGGNWGGVLQITFLCASGLLLLALLFSGQIRARTRVWLSKNFFSYKYDYRSEWLQFTQTLAEGGSDIPVNIIRAMADLTKSPAGLLWSKSETGAYKVAATWDIDEPGATEGLSELARWLQKSEWIINMKEWRQAPDVYENLELPQFLTEIPRAWLIIPLLFGKELQGILLLHESDLQTEINWEDRDLLKVAGRQAASHLAQYQANQALIESRQFEAFNRLSAYVIHDLKNILAQQSLIVSNAEKHRDKPAFIDDALNTVQNSVERMTRLMEQMRSGVRGLETKNVDLGQLLLEAVGNRQKTAPCPILTAPADTILVAADREQLGTVFTHIIQNAQEATAKTGRVEVRLFPQATQAVVEIKDNGIGMDADFLRNRLFKPFDSTKGLTGMGIGAFESREFIRKLGGNIEVNSSPGAGSLFRIVLPCANQGTEKDVITKEAKGE